MNRPASRLTLRITNWNSTNVFTFATRRKPKSATRYSTYMGEGSTHPRAGPWAKRNFTRARVPEVTAILETLTALGQAKRDNGAYHA